MARLIESLALSLRTGRAGGHEQGNGPMWRFRAPHYRPKPCCVNYGVEMGKQLAFYMVAQDEDEFLEFVHSTGDVLIVPETTDREGGEEFSTFRELEGRRSGGGCHLWNRSISPKPIVEYYDAHGGCFCLNFLQSEVVNVWRSKRVGRTLSKGRLHIENMFLVPDGSIVEKRLEFVKWFEKLCRWIRREYPHRFERACLSARAEALSKTGVELRGHSF